MSNTIPTIVTYHSTNNKPEWFAYLKPNGEFLGVRMEGATEAEAIERARNWWINEKARQCRLTGAMELDDSEVGSKAYKPQPAKPLSWGEAANLAGIEMDQGPTGGWSTTPQTNAWGVPANKGSIGHRMAGKVWLIHHGQRQKLRADPEAVDALLAQGWERAGPRTEFR